MHLCACMLATSVAHATLQEEEIGAHILPSKIKLSYWIRMCQTNCAHPLRTCQRHCMLPPRCWAARDQDCLCRSVRHFTVHRAPQGHKGPLRKAARQPCCAYLEASAILHLDASCWHMCQCCGAKRFRVGKAQRRCAASAGQYGRMWCLHIVATRGGLRLKLFHIRLTWSSNMCLASQSIALWGRVLVVQTSRAGLGSTLRSQGPCKRVWRPMPPRSDLLHRHDSP